MHSIRARELFFLYRAKHGDVAALRGLSLELGRSEIVSVLGPSGSGKSTLLNLCAGLRRPSSGSLRVLDLDVESASRDAVRKQTRQSIALVRQHYHLALPQDLTAAEIVALPCGLLGLSRNDALARGHELLKSTGLAGRAAARPAELSGGEQQRVAICAAVAKTPRLILADEPTGELDPETTGVVADLLVGLARATRSAALIVTHDPEVAARADRTIHIRDGRLAAEGSANPVLIVDEHGWVRVPRRLRQAAGLGERVVAQATWGKVELIAETSPTQAGARPDSTDNDLVPASATRSRVEVVVDRLSKRYGNEPVLRDVTWTFGPASLHVVAGASGSGKTTLLGILAGLEQPDGGEVWAGDQRVDILGADDSARWRQRDVGYLSQHSTLVEFLTARENVMLALAARGVNGREAAVLAETCMTRLGLASLAERRADRLSGGEQRRVALARALAPRPRVLLADEPTAHLDRATGRMVIQHLQAAAREHGAVVIAASHDPDLIAAANATIILGTTIQRGAASS